MLSRKAFVYSLSTLKVEVILGHLKAFSSKKNETGIAAQESSEIPVLCISGLCVPFHNWGGEGYAVLSFAPHYTGLEL